MLALRLTRGARPAVQLRRLLVATASAGTGFLLLCALGHAIGHPGTPSASLLRLAWCAAPLAATVHFAVAVARADPGTRPRSGLSALGLGPARLMAISATTTALACTLGSVIALLVFLHLRGDLTGMPSDGAGTDFLAAGRPLPLPATLTLLALVPVSASVAVATALRPRGRAAGPSRTERTGYGRFGAYRATAVRETFGAYGRFGAHLEPAAHGRRAAGGRQTTPEQAQTQTQTQTQTQQDRGRADLPGKDSRRPRGAEGGPVPVVAVPAPSPGAGRAPSGLPWGIAVLAAGLAVEAYASRTGTGTAPGDRPGAVAGLVLAAVGLALAGPGLTHLCGRLLQSVRPGALRLLAGRVLMTEATRIGRPLGVVCAVLSGAYTLGSLHYADGLSAGPLTLLGVLLVTGCTVATLLTAAVEAKQAHAGTTAALLRLGAPASTPRRAAALRAGALLALFGPLTVVVAELSALPLAL
ncbi:hypothetical protein [Streptomyces sp. NEAU-W12]|uniref:hypothetical protein n=1 Tax=Streptomyces sp. NEAU-W12 TaxID=2994668 RepID=UPI00224B1E18|nr:hypothetical protein [Streptomyces sp. NEAU-W12]MCX2923919.1 hypothetical protein [Streptomyces sp. NEAU-W12]